MKAGTTHTEAAREAVSAGMRRRWQLRKERASLVLYSIDSAFEAVAAAERSIVVGGSLDEAEAKVQIALDALKQASDLARSS